MANVPEASVSSMTAVPAQVRESGLPYTPALGGMRVRDRATSGLALQAIALVAIVGAGFLIRLIASVYLTPHVDEAASVLAGHAVAAHGWPILPSGTVYFQGATLSYLLVPFVWLGFGEIEHLAVMRFVLVLSGTITVYLCYRLGIAVTRNPRVGLVFAALVALDPISVQWSGHVRMYGLLQALSIGLAWAWVLVLTRGATWKKLAIVVALLWAAVFTHVGASLLVPAMGVAALLVYGRTLYKQWSLLLGLALCAVAPIVLLVLNSVLGSASVNGGEGSSPPVLSFVGDHLMRPLARFRSTLSMSDWDPLVRSATLFWLIPGLMVAICTIVGGKLLLRDATSDSFGTRRNGIIALLCLYWLPVTIVGLFIVSPKERYLLHVHLIGYLFAAVVLVRLATSHPRLAPGRWRRRMYAAGSYAAALAIVAAVTCGLVLRLGNPIVQPNYHAAMSYVEARQQPGQPVIVILPAVAYLTLDDTADLDLYYLPTNAREQGAEQYIRSTADGRSVDYWVGIEPIVTTDHLRRILSEHPDAWIVIDEDRMSEDWAYESEIEILLRELTAPELRLTGGALVLRPNSTDILSLPR